MSVAKGGGVWSHAKLQKTVKPEHNIRTHRDCAADPMVIHREFAMLSSTGTTTTTSNVVEGERRASSGVARARDKEVPIANDEHETVTKNAFIRNASQRHTVNIYTKFELRTCVLRL